MSAASVTAYLSPTTPRNFAISSGESGGADGCTIFIVIDRSLPSHGRAAQPVVDGFAQSLVRDRNPCDRARILGVERAKIAEKIGGGFVEIAARREVHHRGRRLDARQGARPERQQSFAGRGPFDVEPNFCARRVMRG